MRRNRRQKKNVIIKCGEFDYDKLTATFIKAQKEYDQMVIKETELSDDTCEEKISFWKAVKIIVKNERPTNGTMVSKILASILSVGCNIMALLLIVFAILFLVCSIQVILNHDYAVLNDYITAIYISFFTAFIFLLALLIALLFRASANEIKAENDRNYIIALFSGIVSFVALIVALIAMFNDNSADIVTILEEIKEYYLR